ncbi:hypothetical protein J5N97_009702 [Dioscorea zingiberensis]|uniref:Protein kinase domain-containing protein n=1 Tax=Dioscorea zingiberensis TaxID=325984 RepID=A0A9D5CZ91_9LILI|nr:hypothetical protein J5N97_009702 [Dioscorea zingiberensis]
MGLFSCNSDSKQLQQVSPMSVPSKPLIFSHAELAIATSNFSPSSLLGRGSQSSVFLASFPFSPILLAAAKLPSPDAPSSSLNEISILSCLPRSHLLVNLLGFTISSPSIAVVELMPSGSLHHLLHGQLPPPPWPRRLHLALLIARALYFLHSLSPPVIHRDVKPSNILLDSCHNPRLADFGLAVILTPFCPSPPPPAGTLGYIDPSYTSPDYLSTKTDVYSFGVLLFELISGRRAIDVDHSPQAISDWGVSMVRQGRFDDLWDRRMGAVESKTVTAVATIAARCVSSSPEERPEMEEVVACLSDAESRVRSPPVRWRKWMTCRGTL